jgi:tol-pal system protein YbgF
MIHRGVIFSLLLSSGLMLTGLAPAHAQLFGESDEEKAARQAHENAQDAQTQQLAGSLATLSDRVKTLEDNVQSLTQALSRATGANEDLSHQLALANERLDRAEKDFAYRLCMLSAQQLGAAPDNQGLNCAAASAGTPPPAPGPSRLTPGAALPPLDGNSGASAVPGSNLVGPGRPPGVLGTLPSSGPGGNPSVPPAAAAAAPARGATQFDAAMNLLAKAQYTEASAAFRAYADANPNDEALSSQAIYWVGNIAFIRQDYPSAARAFAEELKKYPHADRSPDAMLKLGQALLAQGQTSAGCTTLGLLKTKYPNATQSTLAAAAGARKASCSK